MKIHFAMFVMLVLVLSGCAAKPTSIPTPSQMVPTSPVIVQQQTTAAPVLNPATNTATPEVEAIEPTTTAAPTATAEPTPTAAVLIMDIVGGSPQSAVPQSNSCQRPANWVSYTVQRSDTLSSLAQRTGTNWQQIQAANCLVSTTIFAGQTLLLPFMPQPASTDSRAGASTPTIETPFPPSATLPSNGTIETPPAPNPGDPNLAVTPKQGPAGTAFVFALDTFMPGETVTFIIKTSGNFQEVYRTTVQMSSLGNALVTYQSPTYAEARTYFVQALGGKSATTDFTITAP